MNNATKAINRFAARETRCPGARFLAREAKRAAGRPSKEALGMLDRAQVKARRLDARGEQDWALFRAMLTEIMLMKVKQWLISEGYGTRAWEHGMDVAREAALANKPLADAWRAGVNAGVEGVASGEEDV